MSPMRASVQPGDDEPEEQEAAEHLDRATEELSRSREQALIASLREEAYAVRDCFTRYSFQAVTVATIGLGFIARYQIDQAYIGLLAMLPVLLMFAVATMGNHKYATSNRLLGYELHLQRTRQYTPGYGLPRAMRDIGWEEAMRAWRIVAASLFESVYFSRGHSLANKNRLKYTWRLRREKVRVERNNGLWFEPSSLLAARDTENVVYYAGGYLQTMLKVIGIVILSSFAVMLVAVIHIWIVPSSGGHLPNLVPGVTFSGSS